MSNIELQKSIKDNSEELQDYLRDLKNWENDIKLEDMKLIDKDVTSTIEDIPPVRKKEAKVKPSAMIDNSNKTTEKKSIRILSSDYEAWEKFDVDKALESDTEDEDSYSETKKERKNSLESKVKVKDNKEMCNSKSLNKEERAERLKEEGNECYSNGKLSEAIAKYTQGMGLNPSNPLLPANRAMAYIKLKKYKAAEKDCTKALNLDAKYIKAYLRRATARINTSNIQGAIEDYEKVLKLESWNKDAKRELEKLKKESKREHQEDKFYLHESTKSLQKDSQIKKIKIEDIDSSKIKINVKDDSKEVFSISKPIHLQSTKPLTNVPVIEVNSKKELETLLKEPKRTLNPSTEDDDIETILNDETEMTKQKVPTETQKPVIPNSPRTSHQFAQDWYKVKQYQDLAQLYLKSIPVSFFHGTEIEVDHLVEIVDILSSENFETELAASTMAALMMSRGFFLNIAFLDDQQKKAFERIILKIENQESWKEVVNHLKEKL